MPFLLAEILNFQGSIHRIGVGSFSYVFTDEGYVFGEPGEGFERINFACPTQVLEDALNRMYDAWTKRQER